MFLHDVLIGLKVMTYHALSSFSPNNVSKVLFEALETFIAKLITLVLWKLDFPLMSFAIVCALHFTFLVTSCLHYICLAQEMLLEKTSNYGIQCFTCLLTADDHQQKT